MKKKAITLIETLICLTLLTFLFSTLFYWYYSFSVQREKFEQLKWPLLEERCAFQRLQKVIPSAKFPFFSTEEESLVFLFDRGPWLNSELADTVLGRLYFNQQQRCLCLGIWPNPLKSKEAIRSPSQTFVLLEGVEKIHLEYYSPPDPFKLQVDPEKVGEKVPQSGWQAIWLPDYKKVPAMVKLHVTREKKPGLKKRKIEYLFDLAHPVIFPSDEASLS